MTVSIDTTRLSSVITGCGGNETTLSRRSTVSRTRSMNGVIMLRPAGSVVRYLPNRSTTEARACGTILIVSLNTDTTRMAKRIRKTVTAENVIAWTFGA